MKIHVPRPRWWVVLPLCLLAILVTAYVWELQRWRDSFRKTDFSVLSKRGSEIGAQVEFVRKVVQSQSFPSITVDHASLGRPGVEKELIALSKYSRVYEVAYHRLPASFDELKRSGLPTTWKEDLNRLEKDCQIIPLSAEAGILNCDGWKIPGGELLNLAVRSFEPGTERFYEVQGHIVLYLAPATSGMPIPPKTVAR